MALTVAILVVLGSNVALRRSDEQRLMLDLTLRDRRFFAHALQRALLQGPAQRDPLGEATRLIEHQDIDGAHIEARLVSLTDAKLPRPTIGEDATRAITNQDVVVDMSNDEILTYVPVAGADVVIELSEPHAVGAVLERLGMRSLLYQTAALIGLAALLMFALVRWMVGGPLSRLADVARQVGRGDLTVRASNDGSDEVGILSREVNLMIDGLQTGRKALEEADFERTSLLERLRHADRLRTVGELASALAHELGTPLNVVSGHARLIEEEVTGDALDSVREILEQSTRMTRVLRNVLDFSRRDRQVGVHDVHQLVTKTVDALKPLAARREMTVAIADERDGGLQVCADAQQVLQVLTNLVVNAMQAMPNGGRVRVSWRSQNAVPPEGVRAAKGTYAVITVSDTGNGIPPGDLPRLFEPFFTRKAPGTGTGLGLAVVEGIMREHGGWVAVTSELGKGTSFDVMLPAYRAPDEALPVPRHEDLLSHK
ncbi:MAG: HAMP domain-containing histidine kinase [Clostridia bacterium]|nr:HAMP domain-containing histidine kinase [Deltaproteobacteria bacterium]